MSSTTSTTVLSPGRISVDQCIFLSCDLQERFRTAICDFDIILRTGVRMMKTAEVLNIPVLITEHYSKAFGATCSELMLCYQAEVIEKRKFSMVTPETVPFFEKNKKRKIAVIFGVEAHVCVQQTALDLLAMGYEVHVLVDGCSSNTQWDRRVAFTRMRQSGIFESTSESVIYELLGTSTHDKFKDLLNGVIKTKNEDRGDLLSAAF
eukprot:Nk52_evm9s359 gene=Nk52_evmTU9s359